MRIESLTFFRFIAAVIVVIFHFGRDTQLAFLSMPFLISGPQMVTFFFVLSGFVMMVSHYHKKGESLKNYYMARIARIAPLYFIALIIMAYFVYGTGKNDLMGLFLSATFMQSWFSPYPLSFNDPAWSLSVEALFYLCFPLILFIVKQSQVSAIKLTFIAVTFYVFTQLILINWMPEQIHFEYTRASFEIIYYFPMSHLCSFVLGVAAGYLYVAFPNSFNQTGALPLMLTIAALYLSYYFLQNPEVLRQFIGFPLAFEASFFALLFVLLILAIAQSKNVVTKILSARFLVILGESSYALYILQKPMYIIYTKYLADYFDISQDNHFYLFLLLLIITAVLAFYVIEKPAKNMIKKLV